MKFPYIILLSLIVSAGLQPILRSVCDRPCSDYTDIYSSYIYPENPSDIPSSVEIIRNTAATAEKVRQKFESFRNKLFLYKSLQKFIQKNNQSVSSDNHVILAIILSTGILIILQQIWVIYRQVRNKER